MRSPAHPFGSAVRWTLALVAFASAAVCDRLPIRAYGEAEGLPSEGVNAIRRDSRGFLWFATDEGLARFDGYDFESYGRANGLPRDAVFDFLETRAGEYWAATSDGLAKFQPEAPAARKFVVFRPAGKDARRMYVLYEDRSGQVWCGTEGGLLRLRRSEAQGGAAWRFERVPLILKGGARPLDERVRSIFEDSRGNLWIGTFQALYRRARDGALSAYVIRPREGSDFLWNAVFEDHAGRLWAGTGFGLWRILAVAEGYKILPVFVPKQRVIVWSMLEDEGGKLWLATSDGLVEWRCGSVLSERPVRIYRRVNGLSADSLVALCTDREGNLWLGAESGGAMRVARGGFVAYDARDHISFGRFTGVNATLFPDNAGNVHVAFHHVINALRGNRFIEITPAIPRQHSAYLGWGWHQTIVHDRRGEWWFPTAEGLVRFPSVPLEQLSGIRPKAVYTTRNGLRTNDIFRVFEDRAGGIWLACIGPAGMNGLSRWDRGSDSFRHFGEHSETVASAFAEDREGAVWIGYYDGTLARFRNGGFAFYSEEDGLAGGGIQALHTDCAGRIWIASLRGLTRIDEPTAARPRFQRFGVQDGLSSNIVLCIAEDRAGRIYIATGHGIDRIGAAGLITPMLVRHYTQADGLAGAGLRDLLFDRAGVLWSASQQGISRMFPEAPGAHVPSPVFIRRVRIRGVALDGFSENGAPPLTLAPNQNQLQMDFSSLAFAPGDVLRYQYRLEPAERSWSPASSQRTVNYSSVAPGKYRFTVRLVRDGVVEGAPAVLQFTVLAPFWQRWWFRLLLALSAAAMFYWLHRYRTLRLLELERVRTRIATDLHDDIGSGLCQIAVLTEVAQMRVDGGGAELKGMLARIGSVSRDLSESMSDIVWSVNPQRDQVSDLLQRMRRFSSDVFSGGGIDFQFRASLPERAVPIAVGLRREIYLIFKEAVNNVVRHSHCTRAEVMVSMEGSRLELRVEDNGAGFGKEANGSGHGLGSMAERARRMGAELDFGYGQGGGTRVVLRVPVRVTT